MKSGLWVWPSTPKAQKKMLKRIEDSPHLMAALAALNRSKEGLSNSELDLALGDNSEWMTLWVIRQLTSLGFVEFRVDFFGSPARYLITEAGKGALSSITGQPIQAPPKPAPLPVTQPVQPPPVAKAS